jgi:hypothetical protein
LWLRRRDPVGTGERFMAGTLAALYNRCVDALSFGNDYQKLRRLLNARIDSPVPSMEMPLSHPAGYVRELKKRRISIVDSYLVIIRSLESEHHRERINALRMLGEQTSHAKNLTMPLNTARVQIALMKEAIKSRDNKRRQLECLYDFTVSSYGQPSVIRARLDELGIIEVPETGQRLADMNLGWDRHVHDNSSYGRKTPSQLVIDAFIKGISTIRVAFNRLDTLGNVEEVLAAGEILGVRVEIGAEFSVSTRGHRFHFMYLLPAIRTSAELQAFFERNHDALRPFLEGLGRNQESRIASIHALIDNFNAVHLPALNSGWEPGSVYALGKLDLAAVEEIVPLESLNRMHLGELLYSQWKPVLLRRVLQAKSRVNRAREELAHGSISRWDFSNIEQRYLALRKAYTELNPENLRAQYFGAPQLSEYPTIFTDLEAVSRPLKAAGGSIKILHPLEHGLDAAYEVMLANAAWIDSVEVYNMYDSINRSVDDTQRFARFVNVLNSGEPALVRPFLEGHDLHGADADLDGALAALRERPLVPVCGSDSTGRSTAIPGMGFIFRSRVQGPRRRHYLERHFALPEFVSRIVAARGTYVPPEGETGPHDDIITMGKSTHFVPNRVGDETEVTPIPLARAARYFNPTLRNLLMVGIGFVVAWLTIGWQYALVWFGITSGRHVIVDLIARRGAQVREWSLRTVDWRNVARSLFWTGFSVPLLSFVKYEFDVLWPLETSGMLYQFAKFFFIALVNGFYLMSHNILRGFPRGVAATNVFRTILSWPFASLFAPLGDLVFIPSVVQAKFWSDVVGGIIEGSGKFIRAVALSRRDLSEIVPLACSDDETVRSTAILDLLYLFGRETRARDSLREIFFGRRNLYERIGDLLKRRTERPRPCQQEYRRLCAWFDHDSNYYKLADFVVERYGPEWALMLIDLLERQYLVFREWLTGRRPAGRHRIDTAAARPAE